MKPLGVSIEQMAELLPVVDALDTADQAVGRAHVRSQPGADISGTEQRRAELVGHLAMADELLTTLRDH